MLIAEFCQNHNGDFEILKDMIYKAAENGATHGKVQAIYSGNVSYRSQFEEGLIENGIVRCLKRPYKSEYRRLKSLELSSDELAEFCEISTSVNLIPMVT